MTGKFSISTSSPRKNGVEWSVRSWAQNLHGAFFTYQEKKVISDIKLFGQV